ncbi:MAG: hypothetical protein DWG83_00885 [Chloroflexi bacterium]|nr:hypothetical protein [Chloroflexota bacterium]
MLELVAAGHLCRPPRGVPVSIANGLNVASSLWGMGAEQSALMLFPLDYVRAIASAATGRYAARPTPDLFRRSQLR